MRAFDRRQMMALDEADVCFAVREVYESAVLMGRHALAAAGVSDDRIIGIERDYRTRDADRLAAQSATGDLHAMDDTLFRPFAQGETREA